MKRRAKISGIICAMAVILGGCGSNNHGLSTKETQSITVWHYYSGALAGEFDALVDEFNNTVGHDRGIEVCSESKSSIEDLVKQLHAAADREVGAAKMPNIFHCYLDTAVSLEETIDFVCLDDYITAEEKESFFGAYVEEGTFGADEKWKLFPVAKSTEILMLNKTDWDKFAADTGVSADALATWEGLTEVAEQYYEWSGGKAFYGRDAFANYMLVGSMQLGKEIFQVSGKNVTLQFDREVMRKLWDNFYVPYVKGYFKQVGRYRSDDIKLGEIIAQTCSTSSAVYFPSEVTTEDNFSYPIDYMVLPVPNFEGTSAYAVQQGASMAVTKATEREEYASIVFLQWFTEKEQSLRFNGGSGYLPVKYEAAEVAELEDTQPVIRDTIATALEQVKSATLFTPDGFANGAAAREVLNTTMVDLAVSDRESAVQRIAGGEEESAVLEEYLSDACFEEWYQETLFRLQELCSEGVR